MQSQALSQSENKKNCLLEVYFVIRNKDNRNNQMIEYPGIGFPNKYINKNYQGLKKN